MRKIEQKDIEVCVSLVAGMLKEGANYRDVPLNPDKIRKLCQAAIDKPDVVFCVLCEDAGEIVGGMMGVKTEMMFSDVLAATEIVLYVSPKCRGGGKAVRLVRAFEDWAKEGGCQYCNVGVSIGIDDEKAVSFYKALGYKSLGASLQKGVSYV